MGTFQNRNSTEGLERGHLLKLCLGPHQQGPRPAAAPGLPGRAGRRRQGAPESRPRRAAGAAHAQGAPRRPGSVQCRPPPPPASGSEWTRRRPRPLGHSEIPRAVRGRRRGVNLPGFFIKSVSLPGNSRPVLEVQPPEAGGASSPGADTAWPLLLARRWPQCSYLETFSVRITLRGKGMY